MTNGTPLRPVSYDKKVGLVLPGGGGLRARKLPGWRIRSARITNTPLQYMVDYSPRRSRLIFQVDLFPAHGCLPDNLDEVNEREKDVRYSSRTRVTTDILR